MGKAKYRVAIVGAGYIADWHLKALKRIESVEVGAVCDANLGRAQHLARLYGIPKACRSVEELLKDGPWDAWQLLLPPAAHFSVASTAIENGIHVLLEKPMCSTAKECKDLAALAKAKGVALGVNHNFLFDENYQQLKEAISSGRLGQIQHVDVVWAKELPQLRCGPFSTWMLLDPEHLLADVGSHSVAHLLDLVGQPTKLTVHTSNPLDLGGRRELPQTWHVYAEKEKQTALLSYCFQPGYTEHYVRVRGSVATATVDFEASTFQLNRHSRFYADVDRLIVGSHSASQQKRQVRHNFLHLALSKAGLSEKGHPYGSAFVKSLRQFYQELPRVQHPALSTELATEVVALARKIGQSAGKKEGNSPSTVNTASTKKAPVLVLGGTGFIGTELVRQLVELDYPVRILSRSNRAGLPAEFDHPLITVMQGNFTEDSDLEKALEGIDTVFHLARTHSNSWQEYLDNDVRATRQLGLLCKKMGIRRLIYTGSISSYYSGASAGKITEETPVHPDIEKCNSYSRCKAETEQLLLKLAKEEGVPAVVVRPGIVLGKASNPFHWGVAMWKWNSVCQLWGNGENPLPIVLVQDVASAMVQTMLKDGIEGESFNLVGDTPISALKYIDELKAASGIDFDVHPTPIWKFYAVDMLKWSLKTALRFPDRKFPCYKDWDARTQAAVYDNSKAKKVLEWKPEKDLGKVIERGIREPVAYWLG